MHDFDAAADQQRDERRFAYQLVRALDAGYELSLSEDSDILISNPVADHTFKTLRDAFVDTPAQAVDALRRALLDIDEAAGDRPIDAQPPRLSAVGTYYRDVQRRYFTMGGDHICYSSG